MPNSHPMPPGAQSRKLVRGGQHGGTIVTGSVVGEYTEMVISVPAEGAALAASA